MEKIQRQIDEEEKLGIEVASLNRLLEGHHEFFNFINIHDGWYRWVSGRYTLNTIDSMGETLINYIDKFWETNNLHLNKTMSSDRLLVVDYKGVYFLLRKLDGKDEFAAINLIDGVFNMRTLCWEKFYGFLQSELKILKEEIGQQQKQKDLAVPFKALSKSYVTE